MHWLGSLTLLQYKLWLIVTLFSFTVTCSSVTKPQQCLKIRDNDVFLNICPATEDDAIGFSAVFPDATEIPRMTAQSPSSSSSSSLQDEEMSNQLITLKDDQAALVAGTLPAIVPITQPTHRVFVSNQPNAIGPDTSAPNKLTLRNDKFNLSGRSTTADQRKPLLSFEEWQKQVLEMENARRHTRKKVGGRATAKRGQHQTIDALDGGFVGDFGFMFEGPSHGQDDSPLPDNTYDEDTYIEPSKSTKRRKPTFEKPPAGSEKKKQFADVPIKMLKERFNYASTDCAATVRAVNKEAKGAQSILYESKDQYMLNRCSADKYIIINLCEEILIDTIVLANFEFFSSTFKDFRVYVADRYPTKDWKLLGQWQARNTRDLQIFKVEERPGWFEYMKIEFVSHYGHEYYCPLSLLRVHGMPMMEYFNLVERQGLSNDGDEPVSWEDEYLWPAEVRDEIIRPQPQVTNPAEQFPIPPTEQTEEDVEEEIVIIEPIVPSPEPPSASDSDSLLTKQDGYDHPQDSTGPPLQEATGTTIPSSMDNDHEYETNPTENPTPSVTMDSSSSTLHGSSASSFSETPAVQEEPLQTPSDSERMEEISSAYLESMFSSTATTATPSSESQTSNHIATVEGRVGNFPKPIMGPNPKEGTTQESIYKTIMKRLNVLEQNATLSQRYLDEQNRMLNDVFTDMEKRHQEQLISLLGRLNETASNRIENMKRRYEQWYEELKIQNENDIKELTAKMSLMADQIAFERRISISQLVIVISLFVFMALSRGTFNTLSPIMVAQAEERKRRASADQIVPGSTKAATQESPSSDKISLRDRRNLMLSMKWLSGSSPGPSSAK
ncbi:UNC-like C-terminal-domain-containing protein [Radiomyces spectabilis]|uniref:UNC-like C-terminal-domain-containing protein n=1 Tax=Radiomyces spectabilis TaxID=64574 RepID=UPI00221FB8A8|nr:UNC-like C-terminal-domain-containing protein [Radiomyces spectabilis]KAI8384291.1 UNC-like C-terminal-domain-containing protein [Radiomyces spectabilis]